MTEANASLSKEADSLEDAKVRLERERESLQQHISDLEESVQDLEARYQSAQNAMTHLRTELTQRIQDRDEELETLKHNSQKTIENLNTAFDELEAKHRAEGARWKKKLESTMGEFEKEINGLKDERDDALKVAHDSEDQCVHLLNELDEINHSLQEANSALQVSVQSAYFAFLHHIV
ncbi:unnamed protein product [Dibothriocephalus latus]|uniref:Myosin tail domain-containing protein n=1 Tax=Dibothriocephalus latus TaxID=60516 RepID=A0A3P7PE53_DIBLA|nr:unnamed protein product [Dibothriocephalus latus]